MNLADLQTDIRENNLKDVYVFLGSEIEVMHIYLDAIKLPTLRVETVREAVRLANTSSLMDNGSKVYVVFNDEEYLKQEKVWSNLNLGKNKLILMYSELDKRSKFYKQHKDLVIEFAKLSKEILRKYIKQKIELSDTAIDELIDITYSDYSRILLEIDKMNHYCPDVKNKTGAFETLVCDGTIYVEEKDVEFKYIEAILTRNVKDALYYGNLCLKYKLSDLYILAILYNNFRHILMVQGLGKNLTGATERTGLTYWQIEQAKKRLDYYDIDEIKNILTVIQDLESGIKRGYYSNNVLDLLICIIFGGIEWKI